MVIAIGIATGVLALTALAGYFVWWYLRGRRGAQLALHPIDPIINIPPASRSREGLLFPSDSSSASAPSPTTSATSLTMARQRVLTLSSVSQPLLFSVASPDEPQRGTGSMHSTVLGLHLGDRDTPTAPLPLPPTALLSPLRNEMDVPPPAYSPPQSRNQPLGDLPPMLMPF